MWRYDNIIDMYKARPYIPEVWATDPGTALSALLAISSCGGFGIYMTAGFLSRVFSKSGSALFLPDSIISHGVQDGTATTPASFPPFNPGLLECFDMELIVNVPLIHWDLRRIRCHHLQLKAWIETQNLDHVLEAIVISLCDQPHIVASEERGAAAARGSRLRAIAYLYEVMTDTNIFPREGRSPIRACWSERKGVPNVGRSWKYVEYRCNEHVSPPRSPKEPAGEHIKPRTMDAEMLRGWQFRSMLCDGEENS